MVLWGLRRDRARGAANGALRLVPQACPSEDGERRLAVLQALCEVRVVSAFQGTPGPWHAWDRGIGWEVHAGPEPLDGKHWWFAGNSGHEKSGECRCLHDGFRETIPVEANARLMAAAPELLRASQFLVALYEEGGNGEGWTLKQAYDMAVAAIAKALGEAP